MKVSEAFRSLTSVPPLLRTIENIPDSASPSDLVDISMGCPAIQSQQIRSEFLELAKLVKGAELPPHSRDWHISRRHALRVFAVGCTRRHCHKP